MRPILIVAFLGLAHCGATPGPTLADEAQVAEYETAQLGCVAEAGTGLACVNDAGAAVHSAACDRARLEADRCRCSVHAQAHRDCDGGVP